MQGGAVCLYLRAGFVELGPESAITVVAAAMILVGGLVLLGAEPQMVRV